MKMKTLKDQLPHLKGLRALSKNTCVAMYKDFSLATGGLVNGDYTIHMTYDAMITEHLDSIEKSKYQNKACLTCNQCAIAFIATAENMDNLS
jgi:hypothetical protein